MLMANPGFPLLTWRNKRLDIQNRCLIYHVYIFNLQSISGNICNPKHGKPYGIWPAWRAYGKNAVGTASVWGRLRKQLRRKRLTFMKAEQNQNLLSGFNILKPFFI